MINTDNFWKKVNKSTPNGCWEWTASIGTNGYGQFAVNRKSRPAHRVSAEIAGLPVTGMVVCHRCDNPLCVNPSHLFVGTHRDNTQDCINKGRFNRKRKISFADATKIRQMYATGKYTYKDLGDMYNMTPTAIAQLITYKTYLN